MVEEGADLIDVGGESTRPGSATVPATVATLPGLTFTWWPPVWMIAYIVGTCAKGKVYNRSALVVKGYRLERVNGTYFSRTRVPLIFWLLSVLMKLGITRSISSKLYGPSAQVIQRSGFAQ